MEIKEIAYVCFAVNNLAEARKFYEGILGLKQSREWVQSDTSGFIEYNIGKESCIAIGAGAESFKPGKEGACVALEIEDFDNAVKELKKARVKFVTEPNETPVCFMGIIEDPFGNQIMLHKRKN